MNSQLSTRFNQQPVGTPIDRDAITCGAAAHVVNELQGHRMTCMATNAYRPAKLLHQVVQRGSSQQYTASNVSLVIDFQVLTTHPATHLMTRRVCELLTMCSAWPASSSVVCVRAALQSAQGHATCTQQHAVVVLFSSLVFSRRTVTHFIAQQPAWHTSSACLSHARLGPCGTRALGQWIQGTQASRNLLDLMELGK